MVAGEAAIAIKVGEEFETQEPLFTVEQRTQLGQPLAGIRTRDPFEPRPAPRPRRFVISGGSAGNGRRNGGQAAPPTQQIPIDSIIPIVPIPQPRPQPPSIPIRSPLFLQDLGLQPRLTATTKRDFFGTRRRGRRGARRQLVRQPSLISAVLGITSNVPVFGEESGLVPRPIIRRKKKKKR